MADHHRDLPPLAPGDPDLVLDVDFTAGESVVRAQLETAEGLLSSGVPTGVVWDPVRGLNTNASFGWSQIGWNPSALGSRAEMYAKNGITVYWEVERSALASTWLDYDVDFIDTDDGPSVNDAADFTIGVTTARYLSSFLDPDVAPYPGIKLLGQLTWSGSNPRFSLIHSNTDLSEDLISVKLSRAAARQLGDTVKIAQTIDYRSRVVELYIDGLLRNRTSWDETFGDDANKTDIMKKVSLLQDPGQIRRFKGFVKRLQVIKRACKNRASSGHRVAFFGDSIVGDGTAINAPSTQDVAGLDAVQNNTTNAYARSEVAGGNPLVGTTHHPWIVQLEAIAASTGRPFHSYVAGASGGAWASTAGLPIPDFYRDAVAAYNPQIIVCLGSVNDIGAESTTANVELGIKSRIDYWIANCPRLKQILFLTTFPTVGLDILLTPARKALLAEHVAMQRGLEGYGAVVTVFDLWSALGGFDADGAYAKGSHPLAPAYDARYAKSITGADVHPGQTGQSKMAELIWPVLEVMLYGANS